MQGRSFDSRWTTRAALASGCSKQFGADHRLCHGVAIIPFRAIARVICREGKNPRERHTNSR